MRRPTETCPISRTGLRRGGDPSVLESLGGGRGECGDGVYKGRENVKCAMLRGGIKTPKRKALRKKRHEEEGGK